MKNTQSKKGFTLIELLVSVGITAVLMVGISAFFSSTFRSMFLAREKVGNSQSQFVVGSIMQQKFANTEGLQSLNSNGKFVVLKNSMDDGDLPFTYIGTKEINGLDRVVFRDFFVFNGLTASKSSMETKLINPGGITKIGKKYYVTSPQENAVYVCDPIDTCSPISTTKTLNYPIDITNDGTDLYVTEAGNNRIVKITVSGEIYEVSEVTNGLYFPTGIEFYRADDGVNYLFVSDTYNNVVKKVKISDGTSEVVVGDGDDKDCENTAKYCRLSFPTGLMIHDAGSGKELYISDTGNGRVLKVSDPNPDLSDFELPLVLGNPPTQILRVDFVLPDSSTINSFSQGASGNTMHPTKYSYSGSVISASLTGQTTGNSIATVCGGNPEVCTKYFRGFYVNDANNIFESGDGIDINGTSYTAKNISDEGDDIQVLPANTTINPDPGTDVRITNTFSDEKSFFLNLSDVIFPSAFNIISIQAYDENDSLSNDPPDTIAIRIGDGELGTIEDTISPVSEYVFPTGLGWDSNKNELIISATAVFSTEFPVFDYTSDFSVTDFIFEKKNDDDILDLTFTAKLAEDSEGNPILETITLSADTSS